MAKRLEESPISDEEITELSKTSQVVRTYANGTNIDDDIEFDPAYLRIGQDFSFDGSVEEILSVEVRRPKSQEFFRMHPDPSYRLDTAILEDQKEREIYLVAPKLRDDLADDITSVRIVTWVNSDGDVFLHVLKLPTDNRPSTWTLSALEAFDLATHKWIRMYSKRSANKYVVRSAKNQERFGEPRFPNKTFTQLLKLAFKDRYVKDLDHEVVQRLE